MNTTKRTKFGLTLVHDTATGEWVGPDGIRLGRVRALEFCEGPHPERFRDSRTGRLVTGYCEGDREHDHEVGWDVRSITGHTVHGMGDDLYPTLTEAWECLAENLQGPTL